MGLPPPDAPSSSASSSKPKATASASTSSTSAPDPFANYSTAAQLGYRDEAAERAAAEALEREEEAELRKSEGTIGQWQKVAKPVVRLPPAPLAGAAVGKGKGRAEEGFVGGALLGGAAAAAAAADGIKHEDADVKPDLDLDVKPAPLAGADDAEDDPAAPATKKRRAFLAEKSAFPDDDALSDSDGLPALAPIKLKKRRLTVKEQAAEAAAREAAEREVAEREERRRARDREGAKVGQWESVEAGAEGEEVPLEFEPAAPVEGAQEGEEQVGATAQKEEDKPKVASSAFKKRKMPGAAARRK